MIAAECVAPCLKWPSKLKADWIVIVGIIGILHERERTIILILFPIWANTNIFHSDLGKFL
jgi:hypothetical protein